VTGDDNALKGVLLPGGSVVLDGDKTNQYLSYSLAAETNSDEINRKQKLLISILAQLKQESADFAKQNGYRILAALPRSNFGIAAREDILNQLAVIDPDTMLTQFISGSFRTFENRRLLFPYYDGELARDVIQQTVQALGAQDIAVAQQSPVTLEILNGSGEKGVANTAATLFESYGYKIIAVGNAPNFDYAKTVMFDNNGDKTALQQVASVINCKNFGDPSLQLGQKNADILVVIGKDFNGRYCIGQ